MIKRLGGHLSLSPQREMLAGILASVEGDEGIVKVVGKSGARKRRFCDTLHVELRAAGYEVLFLSAPPASRQELHEAIRRRFSLSADASIQGALSAWLASSTPPRRLAIIVDEAQRVSDQSLQALRLLGSLQANGLKLVRLVLVGTPALYARLASHTYRGLAQYLKLGLQSGPLTRRQKETFSRGLMSHGTLARQEMETGNVWHLEWDKRSLARRILALPAPLARKSLDAGLRGLRGMLALRPSSLLPRRPGAAFPHPVLRPDHGALLLGLGAVLMAAGVVPFLDVPGRTVVAPEAAVAQAEGNSAPASRSVSATGPARPVPDAAPVEEFIGEPPLGDASPGIAAGEPPIDQASLAVGAGAPPIAGVSEVAAAVPSLEVSSEGLLTGPAVESPARPTAEPSPASFDVAREAPPPVPPEEALKVFTSAWLDSWARQDAEDYFNHYHADFQSRYHPSLEAWHSERETRLREPEWIELSHDRFEVLRLDDAKATVRFWMRYDSPGYSDETWKELELLREDGRWLIEVERTLLSNILH